jgi:hypothetical protein
MQRPRTPSKLSESLHHRLNSYALAASASGVSLRALSKSAEYALPVGLALGGAVALSESAEAKIVYTPASRGVYCHGSGTCRGKLNIDLNHDGIADFSLSAGFGRPGTWLDVGPIDKQNEIRATLGKTFFGSSRSFAAALHKGKLIQGNTKFHAESFRMFYYYNEGCTSCLESGPWLDVKNRYLGLKFYVKGKPHFGWARLSTGTLHSFRDPWAILTGYAYETIPNKPIIAGKTHGPDVITVEPASLGHLARGSSAIPAWRESK